MNPFRFGGSGGGGGGADPYFSNNVLLLHCDGADLSTSCPDTSPLNRTVTFGGTGFSSLGTGQKKFGTASMGFGGSSYAELAASAYNSFTGTSNFTIEFWFRRGAGNGTTGTMVSINGASGPRWSFFWRSSDHVAVYNATSGTFMEGSTVLALTNWYHYAFVKSGTSCYLFLNGTVQATATNSIGTEATPKLHFADNTLSGEYFNGQIDEVRISTVARYTAAFTPQTAPFNDF